MGVDRPIIDAPALILPLQALSLPYLKQYAAFRESAIHHRQLNVVIFHKQISYVLITVYDRLIQRLIIYSIIAKAKACAEFSKKM